VGMYDEITVEFSFEEKYKHLQNVVFQTKSLSCCLDNYLVDQEGQLWMQKAIWDVIPEKDRPYFGKPEWNSRFGKIVGMLDIVNAEKQKHHHTGEIKMYYFDDASKVDYDIVCFFDNGKMLFFKVIESRQR
jgi:hypothetical protein